MGEGDEAQNYDENAIFKHLYVVPVVYTNLLHPYAQAFLPR